jgi:hypothetical protein
MIAVVGVFGPDVTALREVFNNILHHVLAFFTLQSAFIPHSLPVRPSVGMTHVFCKWLASHCF